MRDTSAQKMARSFWGKTYQLTKYSNSTYLNKSIPPIHGSSSIWNLLNNRGRNSFSETSRSFTMETNKQFSPPLFVWTKTLLLTLFASQPISYCSAVGRLHIFCNPNNLYHHNFHSFFYLLLGSQSNLSGMIPLVLSRNTSGLYHITMQNYEWLAQIQGLAVGSFGNLHPKWVVFPMKPCT